MKKLAAIFVLLLLAVTVAADEETLSRDEQIRIIEDFMSVTGQSGAVSMSLGEMQEALDGKPIKSGTPAILEFMTNYDRFDRDLLMSLGALDFDRPDLQKTHISPDGYFLIHYDTTGEAEVYEVDEDSDGDGVPDYVESVAAIADSVYNVIVNELGFPEPWPDIACDGGGDERVDLYITALISAYGWTMPDTACSPVDTATNLKNYMIAPSYCAIDNDYQHISNYASRPLDAVRVTLAHELFHLFQFTMDWTEWENLYWLEMSATWMEERIYDDINDYYDYLPFFFETPRTSIEQAVTGSDIHPYASVVFPIYLSETYGDEVIFAIWDKCREEGAGGDFLQAAGFVIDSASNQTESFETAFAEFAIWNYFTGSRAGNAPNDIGYSEKAFYPEIPEAAIRIYQNYPLISGVDDDSSEAEHNAAVYIRFEETFSVQEDRFWACDSGSFDSTCYEKREILDTLIEPYDMWDSVFTAVGVYRSLEWTSTSDTIRYPWGLTIIYQLEDNPDSFFTETIMLPSTPCTYTPHPSCFRSLFMLDSYRVNRFRSLTFIFTPATDNPTFYSFRNTIDLYYRVDEKGAVLVELVDLPPAWMIPYPNPAVVAEMSDDYITFHVQAPTDSTSFPMYEEPYLVLDLFNVAGEHITTLAEVDWYDPRLGQYELRWDMTNSAGNNVASGVYIGYARLYSDSRKHNLLAELKEKVAIIR